MKLDDLKNLDFNKIVNDLRSLDPKNMGSWPLPMRIIVLVVLFVGIQVGGYLALISDQRDQYAQLQDKETSLKHDFENKALEAANIDEYKKQQDEMTKTFGTLLRQLPAQTEIPSLLQDISQAAQVDGLKQDLFRPGSEAPKDFYAEKPIDLQLEGGYHEFGKFVSDVATLPRIVTLHNITIRPANGAGNDNLVMTLQAKTYRYLEDDQQTAKGTKKGGG
ncbi:MAG TPA: type 4a pilus biogenesis protein PilO [Gammaproteobacteria bacterium]|nr:type 4a pilus biogenesis protein PilO [Gammaproteobacteria bacterium]